MDFSGLAAVLVMAALGGLGAKLIRQPPILGYILAGVGVTWLGIDKFGNTGQLLGLLGQLGVTLLLFLVGLELPVGELVKLGRVAVLTGSGQIFFTSLIGFGLAAALGFPPVTAMYLGISLTFSSTIVIVKLLSEKGDLQSLHGKIAVGSLLVQDFVAIGILVALSGLAAGRVGIWEMGGIVAKGVIMLTLTLWLAAKLMPAVLSWLAKSTEVLFITSIGWCLLVAAAVSSPRVGFTPEIGGLLAGLAMANTAQNLQIIARVRPVRDFFLTLFFVFLGAGLKIGNLGPILVPAVILGGFVVVGNPLIMMTILGRLGYKKRVAFLAGITMGQISEFSLVVMAMAAKAGQVGEEVLGLVTLVGVLTMTAGSYIISNGEKVYRRIGKWLPYWEQKARTGEPDANPEKSQIILFGHNRIGSAVRPTLEKLEKTVTVVDFNPQVIDKLKESNIRAVYGDLGDAEMYDDLGLREAELVISTVSDRNDNLALLGELRRRKTRPITVVTADDTLDAQKLYAAGADYVLTPHSVGGELLAQVLAHHGLDREYIGKYGQSHLKRLQNV